MNRIVLALAVTLSTLFPAVVLAQASPGWSESSYMGARLGVVVPQHKDLDGFDNGFAFEVTVGHRFSPNFAVEGSVGRFAMSASVSGYDPSLGYVDVSEDLSAIPVLASAKFIAPIDKLELYGLVGAGLYFVSAKGDANIGGLPMSVSDDDTAFGVHLGAGVGAHLSPQMMLGVEAKYVIGSAKIFDATNRFDSLLIGGMLNYTF